MSTLKAGAVSISPSHLAQQKPSTTQVLTVRLVPELDSVQVAHGRLGPLRRGEGVRLVVQLAVQPDGHIAPHLRREREERRAVREARGRVQGRGDGVVDGRREVCVVRRAISARYAESKVSMAPSLSMRSKEGSSLCRAPDSDGGLGVPECRKVGEAVVRPGHLRVPGEGEELDRHAHERRIDRRCPRGRRRRDSNRTNLA